MGPLLGLRADSSFARKMKENRSAAPKIETNAHMHEPALANELSSQLVSRQELTVVGPEHSEPRIVIPVAYGVVEVKAVFVRPHPVLEFEVLQPR